MPNGSPHDVRCAPSGIDARTNRCPSRMVWERLNASRPVRDHGARCEAAGRDGDVVSRRRDARHLVEFESVEHRYPERVNF